jgi:hypothetical protein
MIFRWQKQNDVTISGNCVRIHFYSDRKFVKELMHEHVTLR